MHSLIPFIILVASLLSSLHQLKEENLDLEFSVDRMVQRRDHLLAVRARLLALSSLTVATPTNSNSQTGIYKTNFTSDGFNFFKLYACP